MPDRIIKESICTSDTLEKLSDFEERFWHRLIVNCDDYGRFDARPAVLKARLFPLRESLTYKNVTDALNRLASVGLIELYTVDGKPFLRVVTWERYQRIRAKKSKFPPPDNSCRQMTADDSKCPRNPIQSNAKCEMRNAEALSAPARADDHTPAAAAVVADYLNRVNPSASDIALEELRSFADALGEAVCKRALDIALDEKKATWSYIRAILRDKAARGVKCLADWDALEAVRPKGPPGPKNAPAPMPGQPGEADRRAREDMEQLRELMRRESAGDD